MNLPPRRPCRHPQQHPLYRYTIPFQPCWRHRQYHHHTLSGLTHHKVDFTESAPPAVPSLSPPMAIPTLPTSLILVISTIYCRRKFLPTPYHDTFVITQSRILSSRMRRRLSDTNLAIICCFVTSRHPRHECISHV